MAASDPQDINGLLQLIISSLNGQLDEEDAQQLRDWLAASEENRLLYDELSNDAKLAESLREQRQFDPETALQRVRSKIKGMSPAPKIRSFPWTKVAAAAILIVGFSILCWELGPGDKGTVAILKKDIPPGSNRATLTMADGKNIVLDSQQTAIIISAGDIKYANNHPVPGAMLSATQAAGEAVELSLSTPRGGMYQVILSDGTKVWLNAASTLTYPTKFIGKSRIVRLKGEAYFEVNKIVGQMPFIVKSRDQELLVLGTAFNLNSYDDEKYVKTTLVSGGVLISNLSAKPSDEPPVKLIPGKQSINVGGLIKVRDADVKSEIAWKNGMFRFQGTTLYDLMRQVSRWYNVSIDVQGAAGQRKIFGEIYRSYTLAQVLEVLEELEGGKVKFSITKIGNNQHKLIVQPK